MTAESRLAGQRALHGSLSLWDFEQVRDFWPADAIA